jgi:hypothetical protein
VTLWIYLSVLPLLPVYLVFLINRRVLTAKRGDIAGLLTRPSIYRAYFQAFGHSLDPNRPATEIKRLFERYYSFPAYVAPLLIVAVLTWAYTLAGLARIDPLKPLPSEATSLLRLVPVTCQAGFWGAYAWGVYSLVLRYRDRDFTPTFAHSLWIGLLASSLLAGFVGTTGRLGAQPLLDFAIGFLPTLEAVRWLQSHARRFLGAKEPILPAESPTLHFLEGATQRVIHRLNEEGIESTHQLAYADPFLLLLRTNLPWVVILDLIDQACSSTTWRTE